MAVVIMPEPIALVSSRTSPTRAPLLASMRSSGTAHGQAVLGLVVVDGVAARDGAASLDALVGATRQNLAGNLYAQAVRYAQQVHGMARPPAHGVDVRKRVGRGDLSEHIWIIYDRSKEINRLNHRNIICHFVDGSIIGSLDSYY